MGLDIYLRWDGMNQEEINARFTGFQNAGDKGYLRQSWGSLEAWNEVFKSVFNKSWIDFICP